jgi:uncharacterized paraquat-inducible protein A
MANEPRMFCKRCYANLDQATESQCARCGRAFSALDPTSYLRRPFPSRTKMVVQTVIMLVLSAVTSLVVAGCLALAQLKFVHSGH